MSDEPALPRKSPCASCPYRKNVPSGIWDKSEYDKLSRYDGEMHEQTATAVFFCHQQDGCVCSGWIAHRDPEDMLAVRLGLMNGEMDLACVDYSTSVELFESGAAAADHGMRDIERPSREAVAVMDKIDRNRSARAVQTTPHPSTKTAREESGK